MLTLDALAFDDFWQFDRVNLADAIRGIPRDGLPTAADGTRSMAAVHTAVASAKAGGQWMDARPPMFR